MVRDVLEISNVSTEQSQSTITDGTEILAKSVEFLNTKLLNFMGRKENLYNLQWDVHTQQLKPVSRISLNDG